MPALHCTQACGLPCTGGMRGSRVGHAESHEVQQCPRLTVSGTETGISAVQTRYTPEQGMGMLGLEQVQLFWERSLDTKVLIGWSSDAVVISVRGTASLRNAIADIQVCIRVWVSGCRAPLMTRCPTARPPSFSGPACFSCHLPCRMPIQRYEYLIPGIDLRINPEVHVVQA